MTTTTETPAVTTVGIVNRADFAACLHEINGGSDGNGYGHLPRSTEETLLKVIKFQVRSFDFLSSRYDANDRFLPATGQDDTIDLNKLATWARLLRTGTGYTGVDYTSKIIKRAFTNLGIEADNKFNDTYRLTWTKDISHQDAIRSGWTGTMSGTEGLTSYFSPLNRDGTVEVIPDPARLTSEPDAAVTTDVKEAFALAIAEIGPIPIPSQRPY